MNLVLKLYIISYHLKDPTALARLWDRILDPTLGISLETHRYFFRSYQVKKVDKLACWLISLLAGNG